MTNGNGCTRADARADFRGLSLVDRDRMISGPDPGEDNKSCDMYDWIGRYLRANDRRWESADASAREN